MQRQFIEEIINAVTHGIGAVLSLAALIVMLYYTISEDRSAWHITSFAVYGISMFILYLCSTLYHSFFKSPKLHALFKIFDHAAIYLLIAGTYTPFLLIPLHGDVGTALAYVIWSTALVGIVLKVFYAKRFNLLSTLCYLGMGWLIIFFVQDLWQNLSPAAFYWLLAGGLAYTCGAVFYMLKKMPFSHCIWHLFVLAGSATHFVAIFFYLRYIPVV